MFANFNHSKSSLAVKTSSKENLLLSLNHGRCFSDGSFYFFGGRNHD